MKEDKERNGERERERNSTENNLSLTYDRQYRTEISISHKKEQRG